MEPTTKMRELGRKICLVRREVSLRFFCTISNTSSVVSTEEHSHDPWYHDAPRFDLYALTTRGS
jgi:hypothetical protein